MTPTRQLRDRLPKDPAKDTPAQAEIRAVTALHPEIYAMAAIVDALDPLPPDGRRRVLDWVGDLHPADTTPTPTRPSVTETTP